MKNITNKLFTIITTILYFIIILCYEIFYCNFEFINKIINTYNFSIFRIIMYIIFYLIYYIFKDRFIDEALKSFNNNVKRKIIFFEIVISIIILIFIICSIIINKQYNIYQIIGIITLILSNIFILYISNDIIKNSIIICLIFGAIFSISIVVNNQLDEKKHFLSAYSLALGNFNWNSHTVDFSIASIPRRIPINNFLKYFAQKPENLLTKNYTAEDECDKPANYYPISYTASSIGIFLAKNLGGSIADIYFAGRLFNVFGYSFLVVLALKLLPYKRKVFYVTFFIPMLLCLASVYSIDGISIGIISIFIAYCLKLYNQAETINIKQILILLSTLILMCISKGTGYIFISLIILILPLKTIIKANKKYIWYIILAIFLILGLLLITTYFSQINDYGDPRSANTNSRKQLNYIINNPITYLKILLIHTLNIFGSLKVMSYLNAPMFFGRFYYYIFLLILYFVISVGLIDNSKSFNLKLKSIFLLTFFAVFITTSTALYLSYTAVGSNYVTGYQMRYIFPIIPLLLMCISIKHLSYNEDKCEDILLITYIIGLLILLSITGVLTQ